MLVTLTSLPQVLFAKHWYCPLSALVILVMFSHLSWLITPPPIFDHATNGAGNPITMQFKDTPSPSLTVLLSTWFTDAGANKIMYNIFLLCDYYYRGTYKVDQSDCRKYEFILRKLVVNHNRNKQHGSKSTSDNLQTWPFEPTEESPRFLRGRLEWVTEVKRVKIGYNFDLRSHLISKRGNGKCWWMTKYQLVSNI